MAVHAARHAEAGTAAVSRIGHRAEMAFLGLVMTLLAFIVERRVLRALRRSR